ncbi:MmyB family transcriptional regulator [Nonomuraea indica]|uniref:MmyB-like transcription regulator ligand binding domain-containing protein n=1 Tax=Nonomuraea indica TaxID=1581193 RepID=A0ABW8AEX1_9ACTN
MPPRPSCPVRQLISVDHPQERRPHNVIGTAGSAAWDPDHSGRRTPRAPEGGGLRTPCGTAGRPVGHRAVPDAPAFTVAGLLVPPINMVRLGLDPRGLAPHIVNLAQVRALLRVRIARQLAAAPDPELTALYEEFLAPHAEEASRPVESEVAIPMVFRFGGRELRLFSTTTTFGTPMDITLDEVAIESYYPTDAESAAYFTSPA